MQILLARAHARTRTCTHTHTHMRAHILPFRVHTHSTHFRKHTHHQSLRACTHNYKHACTRTHTHTCMHSTPAGHWEAQAEATASTPRGTSGPPVLCPVCHSAHLVHLQGYVGCPRERWQLDLRSEGRMLEHVRQQLASIYQVGNRTKLAGTG